MTRGCSSAISRRRYIAQRASSSASGLRTTAGRHFTTLVSRAPARPCPSRATFTARSMLSSSWPAGPAKGRPARSSSSSGGSPTSSQSACRASGSALKTAALRPAHRRQALQVETAAASSGQSIASTSAAGAAPAPLSTGTGATARAATPCGLAAAPGCAAGARGAGTAAASTVAVGAGERGHQTGMCISCSIARWRASRSRLMKKSPVAGVACGWRPRSDHPLARSGLVRRAFATHSRRLITTASSRVPLDAG